MARGASESSAEARPLMKTRIVEANATTDDEIQRKLEPSDTVIVRERVAPRKRGPVPVESKKPRKIRGGAMINLDGVTRQMRACERGSRGGGTVPGVVWMESDERVMHSSRFRDHNLGQRGEGRKERRLALLDENGEGGLPSNEHRHAHALNGAAKPNAAISSIAQIIGDSVKTSSSISQGVGVAIAATLELSDEACRDV